MQSMRDKISKLEMTPLLVISLFLSVVELALGVTLVQTTGAIQWTLTIFAVSFPVFVAGCFFATLWFKSYVFYPPDKFTDVGIKTYVEAISRKYTTSKVTRTEDVGKNASVYGNPDHLKLLFKVETNSWSRSTKAMQVSGGALVQVSTKQLNPDTSWSIAEALTYVPGVVIVDEPDGEGRLLDVG
jgi:hypothetical protein